jgi:phospholipid/cholesterol/gamma-HCH transport system ATP-binding protein
MPTTLAIPPDVAATDAQTDRAAAPAVAVAFDDVSLAFDDKVVLDQVSFTLPAGGMMVFLGASGAGKSTVLRLILGLLKPDAGRIFINGVRTDSMSERELMRVRSDIGMVFQEGALFDSLTVRENTGYRLFEETNQPIEEVDRRVFDVLRFVGLDEYAERMPSDLSGGQRRRVAIARAVAARPRLVLYDEPTTGLDPITARAIDAEIIKLRDLERVTSVIVTHQLRDAFYIATHTASTDPAGGVLFADATREKAAETTFVMLKDGHVAYEGSVHGLRTSTDPYLRDFLS